MNFISQTMIFTTVIILIVCSIACQIIIGIFFQKMIRETDSMITTDNKLLKQCKQKFIQCYRTNGGVANIPVFVDRFLNKVKVCRLSVHGLWHLAGQLMLLSVLVSGIGVYKAMLEGGLLHNLLPYYILSFAGLYLFFGIATMIDMQGSRQMLKTNLIDFLENHVAVRLRNGMHERTKLTESEQNRQQKKENEEQEKGPFTEEDARELEELLKVFL